MDIEVTVLFHTPSVLSQEDVAELWPLGYLSRLSDGFDYQVRGSRQMSEEDPWVGLPNAVKDVCARVRDVCGESVRITNIHAKID